MNTHTQRFISLAAIMMALGVGIGAFGAHALKDILSPYALGIFNTGVQYHFIHALGLFVVGFCYHLKANMQIKLAGYIMLASIFVFSGSLYILAISGIKWLGAITPLGGIGFILAWILLFIGIKRQA